VLVRIFHFWGVMEHFCDPRSTVLHPIDVLQ
jgi:hypothetical protein